MSAEGLPFKGEDVRPGHGVGPACPGSRPGRDRCAERLPGCRRRHGNEPLPDCRVGGRGAAGAWPRGGRPGRRRPRRAGRRSRQLWRDPVSAAAGCRGGDDASRTHAERPRRAWAVPRKPPGGGRSTCRGHGPVGGQGSSRSCACVHPAGRGVDLEAARRAAHIALARTPDQMELLQRAGVVDSGGRGSRRPARQPVRDRLGRDPPGDDRARGGQAGCPPAAGCRPASRGAGSRLRGHVPPGGRRRRGGGPASRAR